MNKFDVILILIIAVIFTSAFSWAFGDYYGKQGLSTSFCQKLHGNFYQGEWSFKEINNTQNKSCSCYNITRYERILCKEPERDIGRPLNYEINLTEPYVVTICEDCPNTNFLPVIFVLIFMFGVIAIFFNLLTPKTKKTTSPNRSLMIYPIRQIFI